MSAIRVEVDPVILRWVISRIPSGSVTDRILESLHAWLKGEKKPTLRQLEEVSRKTYIPFGYFFLDTPPREDFLLPGTGRREAEAYEIRAGTSWMSWTPCRMLRNG